MISLEREIIK